MIYLGLEKGVGVECRMILCVPVAGVLLVIYPGLGTGAADGRVDRTGVVEWWEEQWGQFGQCSGCSAQCAVSSAGPHQSWSHLHHPSHRAAAAIHQRVTGVRGEMSPASEGLGTLATVTLETSYPHIPCRGRGRL